MAVRIKVCEETATRLTFKVQVSIWGILTLWIVFALVVVWLCPGYLLRCTRSGDKTAQCHVQRQLFDWTLSERAVTNVFGAVVQNSEPQDGRGLSRFLSHLALLTSRGVVPVTMDFLWGRGLQERAASGLHEFLDTKGVPSAEIYLRSSSSHRLISALLGTLAVLATVRASLRCSVDKDQGQVFIQRGLLRRRATSYWLADIQRFAIRQRPVPPFDDPDLNSVFREGGALRNEAWDRVLTLALCLKTGEEIMLTNQMFGGERGLRFVRKLEQFRQRPPPAAA